MKIIFTLKSISGAVLAARFASAIAEENVGYDEMGSARLEVETSTWVTCWSQFRYSIMNPASAEAAVVEYDGGFRGFLAQNLLPEELCGETTSAEVIEGSALARHGVEKFVHSDAAELAEAYGLLQLSVRDSARALVHAIAAVQAAKKINASLQAAGVSNKAVRVYSACTYELPCVTVTCRPGGRWVGVDFPIEIFRPDPTHSAVAEATAWLNIMAPVLEGAESVKLPVPERYEFPGALNAPLGTLDDLKKVGISAREEQMLNNRGAFHYWQFAQLTAEQSAALDEEFCAGGRAQRWVEEAKKLVS